MSNLETRFARDLLDEILLKLVGSSEDFERYEDERRPSSTILAGTLTYITVEGKKESKKRDSKKNESDNTDTDEELTIDGLENGENKDDLGEQDEDDEEDSKNNTIIQSDNRSSVNNNQMAVFYLSKITVFFDKQIIPTFYIYIIVFFQHMRNN